MIQWLETLSQWLVPLALLVALIRVPLAVRLLPAALSVQLLQLATLAWHLLADHFQYHYVWLYSGAGLPDWLKIACLWGGEQGTLLLLGTCLSGLSWHLLKHGPHSWRPIALLALAFAVAQWWWSPFAVTPGSALAAKPYQGLNAHLQTVWMALHPPVIFLAYGLLLAPVGAAWQQLQGRSGGWQLQVHSYVRPAWVLLTLGLASGMWWAFQDYTFGQFWHWDPVQTAVFVTWCLVTAQLHGMRAPPRNRILPLASALCATSVPLGLWIVRDDALASSHRYVGDTSAPLMALCTVALALGTARAWWRGRAQCKPRQVVGQQAWLQYAALCLLLAAALAALVLGYAYMGAWRDWPRPSATRPFMDMLAGIGGGNLPAALAAAFHQWDTDAFWANRLLLPVALAVSLLTGHAFWRTALPRSAGRATLLALPLALLAAYAVPSLAGGYQGAGFTSQQTVAIVYLLDVLLYLCAYPLLACALYLGRNLRRRGARVVRHALPVALIHLGALLGLQGALVAGVLDSQYQVTVNLPQDYGRWHNIGPDFSVRLEQPQHERLASGGYSALGDVLHVQAGMSLQSRHEGRTLAQGGVVWRDGREISSADGGTFRQLCSVFDFRYARATADPGFQIEPLIHHGLTADMQVWLPAVPPLADGQSRELVVAVKRFPLLSWLWSGLLLVCVAASVYAFVSRPRGAA